MAVSMKNQITSYIAGISEDAPTFLAKEISQKRLTFLEFIEHLGEFLTSVDTVPRGRATSLVGAVLEKLPPPFLTTDQVKLVTNFLLAKLSDHHSVQPHALQVLAILTSRSNSLPDDLPQQICTTIFREVQNQTLSQNDRRATYTILQNILGSCFKAVESMGGDFVIGFIQQMEAEKDPRNLMIVFNCAQFISSRLRLGPFVEEMFEVLGCYFPIDFTPPTNDPHGISKDDLVLALRKTFAATADFAPYCLPLLLEKLSSDLQSARLDAMQTLAECAPVYGRSNLVEFIGSITSCIKREALMNLSSDLVNSSRDCITVVYEAMAPVMDMNSGNDDSLISSIVELYQDIRKYLEGIDPTKGCLAFSLCRAVANSCASAFCAIVPLVIPALITQCTKLTEASSRHSYLIELVLFIELTKKLISDQKVREVTADLMPQVYSVFEGTLEATLLDSQLEAMKGLTVLTTVKDLGASNEQCTLFAEVLMKKAVFSEDDQVRKQALLSLHAVIKETSACGEKIRGPLKTLVAPGDSKFAHAALVSTVTDVSSFTEVNSFLINQISQALPDNSAAAISHAVALSDLLKAHSKDSSCMGIVVKETALPLLRTAVCGSVQWSESSKDKCEQLLSSFRDTFRIISSSVEKRDATELWNVLQKLYLEGEPQAVDVMGDFPLLRCLQFDSPWQQTRLVSLLEGFVEGAHIQSMTENREAVFESAFVMALNSADEFSHTSSCKIVASILNKALIGSEIHWFLEPIMEKTKLAMSGAEDDASRVRALTLWMWLTKAMESRAHSATALFSSHLVSLLEDKFLGPEAAEGLGFIVQDRDDIFTARLNGTITPLYKQRFFTLNLKALLEGHKHAKSEDIAQNYLTAVSLITSNLPLQVLKPHFTKLVPLLLSSLSGSIGHTQIATLATLSCAVTAVPEVVMPNVDSLITHLLQLATTNSSMRVRISAIECLENLTSLPVHAVTPHQKHVVKSLALVLDDKKRLVRKQAVAARNAWILLEKRPQS